MWGKLSSREKIMLAILGVFLLAYGFSCFVIYPQLMNYQKISAEKEEISSKLIKAQSEVKNLNKTKAKLADMRVKLKTYDSFMGYEIRDGMLLAGLGIESSRYNIEITSCSTKDIVDKKHYFELPLILNLKGNYNNMLNFISYIENMPAVAQVESFSCHRLVSTEEITYAAGVVHAEMTVIVFSRSNPVNTINPKELDNIIYGRKNPFVES